MGTARWKPTDRNGAAVASFSSSSVVVRNLYGDKSPLAVPFAKPIVEVRDLDGDVVAELRTSPMDAVMLGSKISFDDGEHDLVTYGGSELGTLVDELSELIRAKLQTGEEAAIRIIDELS